MELAEHSSPSCRPVAGGDARARTRARCGAWRETIGDVDILVAVRRRRARSWRRSPACRSSTEVIAQRRHEVLDPHRPGPAGRPARGPAGGWGAALQYFTGSKAHNIRIREMAVRKGLKLSEYGLFEAKTGDADRRRDRGGGLRAPRAARGSRRRCARTAARSRRRSTASCPTLIELADIRGDLHTHTNLTDGARHARGDARRGRGARVRLLRGHRPRADLSMQRMTDEKMLAQRAQLRAAAATGTRR